MSGDFRGPARLANIFTRSLLPASLPVHLHSTRSPTRSSARAVLEFITMSLDNGIVLPGITRESIIQLLNDHAAGRHEFPIAGMPRKIRVVERDLSMPEVAEAVADGTLKG